MKALIIGATGLFGSATTRLLIDSIEFDEVTVASRSQARATELADSLGDNTRACEINFDNSESLDRACALADVVVNASGPAIETCLPVMLACARVGSNYCDISAETEVLLLAEGHQKMFQDAGISLVLGAGHHPGVLDLLGMAAASSLDQARSVDLFIAGTLADYADPDTIIDAVNGGWDGSEGLKTIVASTGSPSTCIEDGARLNLTPGQRQLTTQTPDDYTLDFSHWATMEALSVQKVFPSLDRAGIYYGLWPSTAQVALVAGSTEAVAGRCRPGDVIASMFEALKADSIPGPRIHFWARAKGTLDGKPCSVTAYSPQDWASNRNIHATTTRALAWVARCLARGDLDNAGLVTCAQSFKPGEFFAALAAPDSVNLKLDKTFC
jgi:NAD(P)-dependent dehydrogenase (short-subunit alcohol dehydrogenase family)